MGIDLSANNFNAEVREIITKYSNQLPISLIYYSLKDVLNEVNNINKQYIEEQKNMLEKEGEEKHDGC